MNGLFNIEYFHFFIQVDHSICAPLLYIKVHSSRKQLTHAYQSKLVKLLFLRNNCYFTDIAFFILITSKQQNSLSHLNLSMPIDKNPAEICMVALEAQRIN